MRFTLITSVYVHFEQKDSMKTLHLSTEDIRAERRKPPHGCPDVKCTFDTWCVRGLKKQQERWSVVQGREVMKEPLFLISAKVRQQGVGLQWDINVSLKTWGKIQRFQSTMTCAQTHKHRRIELVNELAVV